MTSFELKLQIENFKSLLKPSNTQMHWMKTKALYLTLTVIIDTTVMQGLIAPVTAMLRKVMLYDLDADPHGRRIVLDFQRASISITSNDILVPFFPQVQDRG